MTATWFWEYTWTTEAIVATLDKVAAAGIGRVIFYMGSGAAYWPSAYLPWAGGITEGFSPLDIVLVEANARGIEVEAWWCPGYTARNSAFRARYPDWSISSHPGVPSTCQWLNFSMPEVREFVADVAVELITMYPDLAAIHWDYIRYTFPGTFAELGCAGFDCATVFSKEDISSTVQLSYERLKAAGADLTCAVLAGMTAPENALQYWGDWLAGGYVDRVYTMAYVEHPDHLYYLDHYLEYWQAMTNPEKIICGLKIYNGSGASKIPKTPAQLQTEIEIVRAEDFNDLSFFNIMELTEDQIMFLKEYFMAEIPEHPRSARDILDDIRLGNESSQGELAIVQSDADTLTAHIAALINRYEVQETYITELEAQLAAITGEVAG